MTQIPDASKLVTRAELVNVLTRMVTRQIVTNAGDVGTDQLQGTEPDAVSAMIAGLFEEGS